MSILFFLFFLKNGSTKEAKSNKHKGKKITCFFFFWSKTYIQGASNHDYKGV